MSTVRPAHPRSRGENVPSSSVKGNEAGSSPLTRGKPVVGGYGDLRSGLIPAHAGKTQHNGPVAVEARAHPRSRGENRERAGQAAKLGGSSPLTRGKLNELIRQGRESGLIPAHAGKTRTRTSSTCPSRAHPRSRGENHGGCPFGGGGGGSSPLTRGKPARAAAIGPLLGLIPAHAGKTKPIGSSCRHTRAHPRSRGENCESANGST